MCVCVCVCSSHYGLGWHHYVRQVHQPRRTSNFFYFCGSGGLEYAKAGGLEYAEAGGAVCIRRLSAAAAAVLYSVCKYVNISTTSEFVLMAFVNM